MKAYWIGLLWVQCATCTIVGEICISLLEFGSGRVIIPILYISVTMGIGTTYDISLTNDRIRDILHALSADLMIHDTTF